MKRIALLIGAPDESIPNAKRDIEIWENFLYSDIGGAWEINREVKSLLSPTKRKVDRIIQNLSDIDYALIAFSGHGRIRDDDMGYPETLLCLNENDEEISERSFRKIAPRNFIVMDCCRSYSEAEEELVENICLESSFIQERRKLSRIQYNKQVMKTERGCTKIYSADLNESAEDEVSFTSILIKATQLWKSKHNGIFLINNAMDWAKEIAEEYYSEQNPQYRPGRRHHHLPFAVNPEAL